MRHHAAGLHRNVCRCEAPRVRDFLFLEVEDNHPNRRRQVGLIPLDGDGLDALASHDLGNAQIGNVGDPQAASEVDSSIVIGHHPLVAKGVVPECSGVALAQPLAFDKA